MHRQIDAIGVGGTPRIFSFGLWPIYLFLLEGFFWALAHLSVLDYLVAPTIFNVNLSIRYMK